MQKICLGNKNIMNYLKEMTNISKIQFFIAVFYLVVELQWPSDLNSRTTVSLAYQR